jgi:SAM-dependent methyltransferase
MAWGVWRVPEDELDVLGDVSGLDVMEFGCGAAQWSIALAARGARVTGLDLSDRQLAHARGLSRAAGVELALVQSDGGRLPFADRSFDVVFCDHGAMTFGDPDFTVPEASRVLRSGGRFAFCMATPLLDVCWDAETEEVAERLVEHYFELRQWQEGGKIGFQRTYGDWIRLFRSNGLVVEDLVEIRAPEHGETSYHDFVPREWARRWPAEHIWKARKSQP